MRLVHLSDHHCDLDELSRRCEMFLDSESGPMPDLVVVTGDMLPLIPNPLWTPKSIAAWQRGEWGQQALVLEAWFECPIVAVPGNHDRCDYGIPRRVRSIDQGTKSFTIKGVRFTGLRATPRWRGTYDRELAPEQVKALVDKLNPDADILLTHYPANALQGLPDWMDAWSESRPNSPLWHLHGHEHEEFGVSTNPHNWVATSNAATGFRIIDL